MARRKHQFDFKQFSIKQDQTAMKVGTDGVVLGAWARVASASRILDIGAGTGLIALMAAQRSAKAHIDAVEIDPSSYRQCVENVMGSPWSDRVSVHLSAIQDFESDSPYDCIVTNPPYFQAGTSSPVATRQQARHQHALSFEALLACMATLLSDTGRLSIILPVTEGNIFINMAKDRGLYLTRKTDFYPRKDKAVERLLLEFSRAYEHTETSEIVQYSPDGQWTDVYKALTEDFHLKL